VNNDLPLVSVIITTYNRSRLVFRCLESVLDQDYPNFEVIVVDDCSSDDTEEKFKAFSHPRVTYIRHKKNMRVSAATNTGFKASKGRYVTAIGDDDVWSDRRKLQKQVAVFLHDKQKRIGVVTHGVTRVTPKGNVTRIPTHPKNLVEHILIRNGIIYGSAALTRRDVWQEVGGYDEKIPRGTDSDFFRRIILAGYDVYFIPESLLNYHEDNEDRMTKKADTADIMKHINSRLYTLNKFKHKYDEYKKAKAERYYQLNRLYLKCYKLEKNRAYKKEAWNYLKAAVKTSVNPVSMLKSMILNITTGFKNRQGRDV
jgi:glycosyltransferase involved in cell wall biosynthesis